MLLNKKYREIYDKNGILRIFITKEKKDKVTYKGFIIGLIQFEGSCHINDIISMSKYIDLYERKEEIPQISEKICLKKEFIDFPAMNIILLFNMKGVKKNITEFLEELHNEMTRRNIQTEEKSNLITQNLVDNRVFFLDTFFFLDAPINKWIFSNKNLSQKENHFNLLPSFVHLSDGIEGFFLEQYHNTKSFTELLNLITNNTNIAYKNELKEYLINNLIYKNEKISMPNFILFEKIYTIHQFKTQPKSFKEFKQCLERINKIFIDKKTEAAILDKKINFRHEVLKFCSSFKEDEIHILKKTNIAFHLIENKNKVLDKYYKNNKKKISIKKEKKLAYFMDELSKRLSNDIKHYELDRPNGEFNNQKLNIVTDGITIQTINNSKELFDVGLKLSNCAGNFENLDSYNKKLLFTVEDESLYLGMIHNGQFKEFKGFKNKQPPFNLFEKVFNFLMSENYLEELQADQTLQSIYDKECIHRLDIE